MKTFYTDASFDWTTTEKTEENFVRGKICITDGNSLKRIEKMIIGKVEGLRQYINVFELIAIARAVEIAASFVNDTEKKLAIFTDSKTAMAWAQNGIRKQSLITKAHANALEYLNSVRIQFGGEITFNFTPREQNPAGKLLEIELEKETPYTI